MKKKKTNTTYTTINNHILKIQKKTLIIVID